MDLELSSIRALKAEAQSRLMKAQEAVRLAREAVVEAENDSKRRASAAPPPPPQNLANEGWEDKLEEISSPDPLPSSMRGETRSVTYDVALSLSAAVIPPRSKLEVDFKITLQRSSLGDIASASVMHAPEENDFIGLYLSGRGRGTAASHEEHSYIQFTDGALCGRVTLTLPSGPKGPYDVCYMTSDGLELARVGLICCEKEEVKTEREDLKMHTERGDVAASALSLPPPSSRPALSYLLETQPHISVYQLSVLFPPMPHSLPADWAPQIFVEGDGGSQVTACHALLLHFELPLPDIQIVVLRIPLSRRVEREKIVWRVYPDFLSVRLPMYYTGSVITERPSPVSLEEMRAYSSSLGMRDESAMGGGDGALEVLLVDSAEPPYLGTGRII